MPFLYEKEKGSSERTEVEPYSQQQSTQEKKTETKNAPKPHVRASSFWPKIYRRLGFIKAYNFWLCTYIILLKLLFT